MASHWLQVLTLFCWTASMGWLVMVKVLPPLSSGDPPDYTRHYQEISSPLYWELTWDDQPIGWAIGRTQNLGEELKVSSRAHFQNVPIGQMVPKWIKGLLTNDVGMLNSIDFDAYTQLQLSEAGELHGFRSALVIQGYETDAIQVQGTVADQLLTLKVRSPVVTYDTTRAWPRGVAIHDELTPTMGMRGLKLGQTWRVETYSPMRPPSSPIEVLRAEVEESDMLVWEGRVREVWVVRFRADSGLRILNARKPRSCLWIAKDDGSVLKQEIDILGSVFSFRRMGEAEALNRYPELESALHSLTYIEPTDSEMKPLL